jgi:hypothetical protein
LLPFPKIYLKELHCKKEVFEIINNPVSAQHESKSEKTARTCNKEKPAERFALW